MLHVFYSYTAIYRDIAEKLVRDCLDPVFEAECKRYSINLNTHNWCVDNVAPGEPLWPALEERINESNAFVAIICDYYAEKIAGKELSAFSEAGGSKRVIPILLGGNSLEVWNELKKALPQNDVVWCDLRDGYDDNGLKMPRRDELISACRSAVQFVISKPSPPPQPRPRVIVMGKSTNYTDSGPPREVCEARKALVDELSDDLPEGAVVDLGEGWFEDERAAETNIRLKSSADTTDLCLVSVQPISRVKSLIANLESDEVRSRLKQDLAPVTSRFDNLSAARKLHSLVWIVGGEDPGLGELDGVDFVGGDATRVSQEALYRVGVASECPFIIERFGGTKKLKTWFQIDLPMLLSSSAERPLGPALVMSKEAIREELLKASQDRRRILAISDQGAPIDACKENGRKALIQHVLERMRNYEDMLAEADPSRQDSTLRLLFQIRAHRHEIGLFQTDPITGNQWYILRVEPTIPQAIGELTDQRDVIHSFLAGNPV